MDKGVVAKTTVCWEIILAKELNNVDVTVPGLCFEVEVMMLVLVVIVTGNVEKRERDMRLLVMVEITRDNESEAGLTKVPDAARLGNFTETKLE